MTLPLDARTIASAMGGKVERDCALVPGPGHSPADRSLSVKPDPSAPEMALSVTLFRATTSPCAGIT
jgi:hypothetical protein